jgi:glycosyltransferase involved in cell wall biosynthesis
METVFKGKHILIIVENLPLPFDRRVWQEANTLKKHGADVSVVCPKMRGYNKSYERINDIDIYRHPLPIEGEGPLGYMREYTAAIFWEIVLSFKIYFKKKFHVIHGCNPPDLIFITAGLFKLFGVKYIFDHHDINPELYIAKFNKKGFFYKIMVLLERFTFKIANYSIATNESYKALAIERGKMSEDRIQVVRSGPSLERLKLMPPKLKYKNGKKYLVGYVGVIGEQEGLDLLLESIQYLIQKREDVHFGIIGGGTDLCKVQKMAREMGLSEYIEFHGRVSDQVLLETLNTADVCVNPDRPTEMNNLSTMNKIMEYMALKKPIVQYSLKEGMYSAEKASLYASNTDPIDFAKKIDWLLDNEHARNEMGEYGYQRVVNKLSWKHESVKLVDIYRKVLCV